MQEQQINQILQWYYHKPKRDQYIDKLFFTKLWNLNLINFRHPLVRRAFLLIGYKFPKYIAEGDYRLFEQEWLNFLLLVYLKCEEEGDLDKVLSDTEYQEWLNHLELI